MQNLGRQVKFILAKLLTGLYNDMQYGGVAHQDRATVS